MGTGPRHWEAALNEEELYPPSWNLHLDEVILYVKKKHYGIRVGQKVSQRLTEFCFRIRKLKHISILKWFGIWV